MTPFTGHLEDAQAQRLADGLADERLDQGAERHALDCAECAALVETYRALADGLDHLGLPELPADFTAAVMARVDQVERAAARERRLAFGLVAAVALAAVGALAAAGIGPVADLVSSWGSLAADAFKAVRIGGGVLPGLVSALRVQIVVATAVAAVPLLLGLAWLMPAPRAETV